jgi:hypothetical protein
MNVNFIFIVRRLEIYIETLLFTVIDRTVQERVTSVCVVALHAALEAGDIFELSWHVGRSRLIGILMMMIEVTAVRRRSVWIVVLLLWWHWRHLLLIHIAFGLHHMVLLHHVVSIKWRVFDVVKTLDLALLVWNFRAVLHFVSKFTASMADWWSFRVVFWI